MRAPPLKAAEVEMVRSVLRQHPEVESATVFGSRAKGSHNDRPLRAEAIASELDELPLPYRFDVHALAHIRHHPLLEHIQRVGIVIYPPP